MKTAYRPDIDGLRAIAVMSVVLFHAFPEWIPGGFIGVDVFFVISGFLISGMLFDQAAQGRIDLIDFYARRIRRIFPALIVVLAASLIVGWLIFLPDDLVRLGKSTIASAAFVANFYFWFQSGYFSPDAHTFPLLHMWSLGVEEQFYIAWPLLIIALRTRARWFAAIVVTFCISLILCVALAGMRDLNFYSPFTRAWELMAGAALAWRLSREMRPAAADAAVAVGLAMILLSVFAFDQAASYPGWRAIIPVGATVLIIASANRSRIAGPVLSNSLAVYVGRISYPLYLWHWPTLVFYAAFKFAAPTLLERGLAVALSFVLAALTYRFIERPIRGGRLSRFRMSLLIGGMSAAAVAGLVIVGAKGFENRFPQELQALFRGSAAGLANECLLDLASKTTIAENCIERKRPLVVVWGDSIAAALIPGFRDLQRREDFGLGQLTASSCAPAPNATMTQACRDFNRLAFSIIAGAKPDVVLLHGNAPLSGEWLDGWKDSVEALHRAGISRVIVLGPVPGWRRGLPGQMLRYYIVHGSILPSRSRDLVSKYWDESFARDFFSSLNAEYISAWDQLCNEAGCLTYLPGGSLTASDGVHLTKDGSVYLVDAISSSLMIGGERK